MKRVFSYILLMFLAASCRRENTCRQYRELTVACLEYHYVYSEWNKMKGIDQHALKVISYPLSQFQTPNKNRDIPPDEHGMFGRKLLEFEVIEINDTAMQLSVRLRLQYSGHFSEEKKLIWDKKSPLVVATGEYWFLALSHSEEITE